MPLLLNEEQRMLRDSVQDFLQAEAPVRHLRELRDTRHPDGLSRPLWRQFGAMGFAGALVPEDQGGAGLGHVEAALIMEGLGTCLTPSPFWSTAVVGSAALLRSGNAARIAAELPRLLAGETVLALALEESAHHQPAGSALRARAEGGGYVLDGRKTFVVNGHIADQLIVVARTSGQPGQAQGLSLFLVDAKAPGVAIERIWLVDSHNAARVSLSEVRVPATALLGGPDQGWQILEPLLDTGRLAIAAELLGVAAEAFRITLAYLKERSQFGRKIGSFQALQHRAARVYSQVALARAQVLKAAQALDEGSPTAALQVAVAKAKTAMVATLATQEGVQMHGGMGMTDDMDIGLYMKRARVLDELLGDRRFHLNRVAELSGY